jgi:hypothetical protein
MLRSGIFGCLLLCSAGCLQYLTYEDLVTIMDRPCEPNWSLPSYLTRSDLEALQGAFVGRPVAEVRTMLEKKGYHCDPYPPRSTPPWERLTGSLTRGVLWCEKEVHTPEEKTMHLNGEDAGIDDLVAIMDMFVLDAIKEVMNREVILMRYENGMVSQVAVR